MYDNAMLEYGSELGSPDARHSSSRGASSSREGSEGGPSSELVPGNFDGRHEGAVHLSCTPPVISCGIPVVLHRRGARHHADH